MNRTTTRIMLGLAAAMLIGAIIPAASAGHGDAATITSPTNGATFARNQPISFSAQHGTGCAQQMTWKADGVAFATGSAATHSFSTSGSKVIVFEISSGGNGKGHCATVEFRSHSVTITIVDNGALATITVTPDGVIMSPSTQLTFSATGADAWGNPVAISPVWSSSCTPSGGSIATDGNFTATAADADCTITATQGSISDGTAVQVRAPSVPVPQLATLFLVVAGLVVLVGVAMRRKA